MSSIHPAPKLAYLRPDGDGGLQLVVHTSKGETEVADMTPERAAHFMGLIADFVQRRFKAMEGIGQ